MQDTPFDKHVSNLTAFAKYNPLKLFGEQRKELSKFFGDN